MSARIRGWCPSAHRPMRSGDGLIFRVRPFLSRVIAADLRRLADLAEAFGQGAVEVTGRGGLQIRGVSDHAAAPLLAALTEAGLAEKTPEEEAQRAITSAPGAEGLVQQLAARPMPDLPSKFGFLVDPGPVARALADISGDIRIEAGEDGLIARADGAPTGLPVREEDAAEAAIALAEWFAEARGLDGPTRMRGLLDTGVKPPHALSGGARPAPAAPQLKPGQGSHGLAIGAPFGQFSAAALRRIAAAAPGWAHVSPHRLLVVMDARPLEAKEDLILDPGHPLLRIQACAGAPACAQGEVETRALAHALAKTLPNHATAHISGCAKGCAQSRPADLTLVGRGGVYDVIRSGGVADAPLKRGVTGEEALAMARGL